MTLHQWGGEKTESHEKTHSGMSFWPRFFDCFPIYEPTSSDLGPLAKGQECWDFAGIPKANGEEFITSLAVECYCNIPHIVNFLGIFQELARFFLQKIRESHINILLNKFT